MDWDLLGPVARAARGECRAALAVRSRGELNANSSVRDYGSSGLLLLWKAAARIGLVARMAAPVLVACVAGMGSTARELLESVYELDESDRALVSAELSESVGDLDEVRQAWIDVAVERLERQQKCAVDESKSLEEVEKSLRSSLKGR